MQRAKNILTWLISFILLVILWILVINRINKPQAKKELIVIPDMHIMSECDSFAVALHIYNLDNRLLKCSYNMYIDSNENSLLDPQDVLLYTEENIKIPPGEEYDGILKRPPIKYKKYSLLAELKTDKTVQYYLGIPCSEPNQDLSPAK